MRSLINAAAVAIAASSLVAAAPTKSKSSNKAAQLPGDFPSLNPNNIKEVEDGAFGQLSNLPPPPKLDNDTVISVEVLALNEIIESFFFENFLDQLGNSTFMRTLKDLEVTEAQLKASIESISNVEELHAINANNALEKVAKTNPILPCEFIFPVDDVKSAVQLANRFTDVVDGFLQDTIVRAAKAGDADFTGGVASASQDEAEQNGGFRTWLHERAQSQPFLTTGSRVFVYSMLQDFIVPGTCGQNKNKIEVEVLQPLFVNDPSAKSQELTFKFNDEPNSPTRLDNFNGRSKTTTNVLVKQTQCPENLFVAYINGQSIITEPVKTCKFDEGKTGSTATAYFPQKENDIFGSVIAVIANPPDNGKNFTSVDEVIKNQRFGFAALEVQEKPLF